MFLDYIILLLVIARRSSRQTFLHFFFAIVFWIVPFSSPLNNSKFDTMKILFVITIVCVHFYRISAQVGVVLLLNNGEASQSCNGTEWATIVEATEATIDALYARRNLRRAQTYPAWCAQKCVGYAKGYCQGRHPACNGYRRREAVVRSQPSSAFAPAPAPIAAPAPAPTTAPAFAPVTACQEDKDVINASLDQIKNTNSFTAGCTAVLTSPREYKCLASIDNCRIQKVQLMNAGTDAVAVSNFTSGMSFCSSATIAFKAINDPCVCNVQFNLKNSSGTVIHSHFAYHEPYVHFDHSKPNDNGQVDIYGQTLGAGTYTLDYYPDQDESLLKNISFTVNSC